MLFGHWFEILILLGVALMVFGPKHMIEMGSAFGKMLREFRESTKDLNLNNLLNTEEAPKQTTLSKLSQFSQSLAASQTPGEPAEPSVPPTATVEGSTEPHEEKAPLS